MRLRLKPVTAVVYTANISGSVLLVPSFVASGRDSAAATTTAVILEPRHLSLQAIRQGHTQLRRTPEYTVRKGDTLSGIATRYVRGNWQGLYQANRRVIGGDPDIITPRERLALRTEAGYKPAIRASARAFARVRVSAARTSSSYAISSGFQACVIRRESGGNPYIWNASGHWGLYQFAYGTWVAHGGAGYLFGHAGPAYQTQIFWQTVHEDGTSDWAPYDGCLS